MFLTCQEKMVQGINFMEKCRLLIEAGFTGIDLMGAALKEQIPDIKAALNQVDIKTPSVYSQLGVGSKGELLDYRSNVRAHTLDILKERVELTAEVGADYLIFVPKRSKTIRDEAAFWLLVTMMDEIMAWSAGYPVQLVLEPLNKKETDFIFDPTFSAEIVKTVNHPQLKTMVDTYHMDLEGQDGEAIVQTNFSYLSLIHLSDTDRCLPGEGKINFKRILKPLKEMNFEGPMGLEGKPGSSEALKKCADFLKSTWKNL